MGDLGIIFKSVELTQLYTVRTVVFNIIFHTFVDREGVLESVARI